MKYYTKEVDEVLKEVNTSEDGLTEQEASKRLAENGRNELPKAKQDSIIKLFFDQYEVYDPEFISGWKFKAARGLFDEYIGKWSLIKQEAKNEGNWGLYLLAKLIAMFFIFVFLIFQLKINCKVNLYY